MGIFRIIISKFSYKKKLGLIILFVIDKNLEIHLYCTILFLALAISWRMQSSEELLLDLKKIT